MSNVPSQEDVLEFIADSETPLTKREIGKAFDIKGADRVPFKKLLRGLENDGLLVKHPGGGFSVPTALPAVGVIEVIDIDVDGEVIARPTQWNEKLQGDMPKILVAPDKKGHPSLGTGDRVLARLNRQNDKMYQANVIRRLDTPKGRVMGLVSRHKKGWVLLPTDKKAKYHFDIHQQDLNDAKEGDLAIGEIQPSRTMKNRYIRIVDVIGHQADPKAISIISAHEMGLREDFPTAVIAETSKMKVPPVKGREDLRDIPLVTIDGADARDFDDAVFAEKQEDGSFHLMVAIADVAYYVTPDSHLDREAYARGNSTYFPDRVIPMLPEKLSNDLCSLRPKEDRACMAVHLRVSSEGKLTGYKFVRGLMKSAARLTYEQVQHVYDLYSNADNTPPTQPSPRRGEGNERLSQLHGSEGELPDVGWGGKLQDLYNDIIEPLYEAYEILDAARRKRGALDLDLPERQILIDDDGNMKGVRKRTRLDSHKLIEEFMILANVAAASALEDKRAPCVYRIHDTPKPEKVDAVRSFIQGFGLELAKGQVIRSSTVNRLLEQASGLPYSHLISQVVLRAQSQAVYSPENIGHFGLALTKYAHFTSPIRRYADLIVHRSLIKAFGLGSGGLSKGEEVTLEERSDHISHTERLSAEAERNAVDRFTAAYLSEQVGAEFEGRISGVSRFGLFVELADTGADGLIPMRTLPNDYYIHDELQHALIGRRTGRIYRMGANVIVRLVEADGLTGSTLLELTNSDSADIPGIKLKKSNEAARRGAPDKRRGKPRGKSGTTPKHKRGNKGKMGGFKKGKGKK